MPRPKLPEPLKFCKSCHVQIIRKRQPNGRWESTSTFKRHQFCGLKCFGYSRLKPIKTKQDAHTRARQVCLRSFCNRCGSSERLQVHHQDRNPFNNNPENLESLCAKCHRIEHKREAPPSICAVCGVSFLAQCHRNRNKICSAQCAKIWGRICAEKRWERASGNSAPTVTRSTRKPRRSGSAPSSTASE